MLIWLFVFGLMVVVYHLDRRIGRLERQLEGLGAYQEPQTEPELAAEPHDFDPRSEPVPEPALILEQSAEPFVDESYEPATKDEPPVRRRVLEFDFEELFGRRLPIWAGGITLAVAGILIVKLSIDSGLLTPPVRVFGGLLFGAVLIAAAELALRREHWVGDARVRQALAGAGIASLYASFLVAGNVYGLIGPLAAMLGMASVTALALFLSTRFGPPSALLGLAGGLAAPALIGSDEPNVPLLSLYLALAVGGLCALSRNQRWAWLGISALVGGFGWGLALLIGGALDTPSSISLGLYLLLLGVGLPALGFAGNRHSQLQLIAAIVAAAQMAALVAMGGFVLLNWGLFALLAIASLWLAGREPALERLPAVALLIVLLLLAAWPNPSAREYALVMVGTIAILAPVAVWRLWRKRPSLVDAAQLAALGLGGLILPMLQFFRDDGSTDLFFGLLALSLAAALGLCVALGWRAINRRGDATFAILASAAALLLGAAASLLVPSWLIGVAIAAIGIAMLHLGQIADDPRLEPGAWIFAAVGALVLPYHEFINGKIYPTSVDAMRWTLLALIAALFAWRARFDDGRRIAQFLAPMFLCGGFAMLLPARLEPLPAPLMLAGLAWTGQRFAGERLVPAMAATALLTLFWAALPLLQWAQAATQSIAGDPMLVIDMPGPEIALLNLLIPGVLAGAAVAFAFTRLRRHERATGFALAITLAGVGVHILFKQVFAIASLEAFVTLGIAERTMWELLLLSAAAVTARFAGARWALGIAVVAAGHLVLYSLLLHNPLWHAQAVGGWPIVNMLLPVYTLALALTVAAQRWPIASSANARRALGIAQMVLATLFAFSMLRQLFHGSLLVGPELSSAEDIGRSILAITLAIGFLLWGIARRNRDWRIASLVLMLAAVAKVFLFDASGLEGLTRIVSFMALGLSLIGIGWIYARHLGLNQLPRSAAPLQAEC